MVRREAPLDLKAFVRDSSNQSQANGIQSLQSTFTWLIGTYSNDTVTQELACTPRVTHNMTGHRFYTTNASDIPNNATATNSTNRTFVLYKRQELLAIDPDRVVESSLGGYWYMEFYYKHHEDYQRPPPAKYAIQLHFDATTKGGCYNIRGDEQRFEVMTIRGVLKCNGNGDDGDDQPTEHYHDCQVRIVIEEQKPNYAGRTTFEELR